MESTYDADRAPDGIRPRTRTAWALASTATIVAAVAAAEAGIWPVAVTLAVTVMAVQFGAAVRVCRYRATRRRLEQDVRQLRAAARTGAALLALTAVRNGNNTTATISDDLAGYPDADVLLDELVDAGLLAAAWTETTERPYRSFALTAAGHAILSRTAHP